VPDDRAPTVARAATSEHTINSAIAGHPRRRHKQTSPTTATLRRRARPAAARRAPAPTAATNPAPPTSFSTLRRDPVPHGGTAYRGRTSILRRNLLPERCESELNVQELPAANTGRYCSVGMVERDGVANVLSLVAVRVTVAYAVTLLLVATTLLVLGPRVQDRVVSHLSTNLHNLAHGHLGTLVGSAFVTRRRSGLRLVAGTGVPAGVGRAALAQRAFGPGIRARSHRGHPDRCRRAGPPRSNSAGCRSRSPRAQRRRLSYGAMAVLGTLHRGDTAALAPGLDWAGGWPSPWWSWRPGRTSRQPGTPSP